MGRGNVSDQSFGWGSSALSMRFFKSKSELKHQIWKNLRIMYFSLEVWSLWIVSHTCFFLKKTCMESLYFQYIYLYQSLQLIPTGKCFCPTAIGHVWAATSLESYSSNWQNLRYTSNIYYGCWKKSCTTWDVYNTVNDGINYLLVSTGAGFFSNHSINNMLYGLYLFLRRLWYWYNITARPCGRSWWLEHHECCIMVYVFDMFLI